LFKLPVLGRPEDRLTPIIGCAAEHSLNGRSGPNWTLARTGHARDDG
jgi:hypothetical protein